jgi:hypothetical protein
LHGYAVHGVAQFKPLGVNQPHLLSRSMSISKLLLSALIGILLLPACARSGLREIPSKDVPLKWNKKDVIGLNLSLDDPEEIENLRFYKDGSLPADFGRKNSYVCGPLLDWKVNSGKLYIQGGEVILLSRSPKTMILKFEDGKIQRFKIEKKLYP